MFQTMNKFSRFILLGILSAMPMFSQPLMAKETQDAPASNKIHAVSDLAHEFSFYADGRFHTQYLEGHQMVTNWGTLKKFDASAANLFIFLGCDPNLSYTKDDLAYIDKFLGTGGAVLIMGTQGSKGQNALAQYYGATFAGNAAPPLKATEKLGSTPEIEGNPGSYLELKNPAEWTVLIQDANGQPVMAQRKKGKGVVLVGSRTLAGQQPDAKDNINSSWLPGVLEKAVAGKKIPSGKTLQGNGVTKLGNTKKVGNTVYHYSDYLAPYFDAMVAIDKKCRPLIEKRMGVPLSEGMAGQVGLLATGGGGFSAGGAIGLAVFWEDFPKKEDGMIEFLTHESTHSWVLPYPEVWNEPIATYVGNLVMCDAGHKEEGMRRIESTIKRGLNVDPTMKLYDIQGKSANTATPDLEGGQANDMHWGKSFWIFEELRKQNPEFLAKYFQAKRKYATPGIQYDMDNTVAIISQALGKDMFPWFTEHGMPVSWDKVTVKVTVQSKK